MRTYSIAAIPGSLDRRMFSEIMLQRQFAMYHDLGARRTFLLTSGETESLSGAFPGLEMIGADVADTESAEEIMYLVASAPQSGVDVIGNLYRLFGGLEARVLVTFTPLGRNEVMSAKLKAERMLSSKETAFTESVSTRAETISQTAAVHKDSYMGSDEKDYLMNLLETLKSAAMTNGSAYKIGIFLIGEYASVLGYLSSSLTVLEKVKVKPRSLEGLCEAAKRRDAMPFDPAGAAKMIGFSSSIRINNSIGAALPVSEGEISLGYSMEGSVRETAESVLTDSSSFNLGMLISGVPGTGKTFAAMHIVGQLTRKGGLRAVIISPTDEWNSFGHENGLRVIKLQRPGMHFNFFKCDSGIEIGKFYENLAMLLAAASDAGPYTNTLERCLLSAFRKIYAKGGIPDPVNAYGEIEEAIIEQHGKRTGVGAKYTKHGENARAALENLRSMLNRPEFSKREGENFAGLLKSGVVFDLSGISNKMKQFYSALILNQAYGVADTFDTRGDGELRMIICLEEAQSMFRPDRNSAAAADLVQRIQDFRKRGVGLILMTHSVIDIEPEIRRLCQMKLYFRQSADVARFAANDLLFGEMEKELLTERLKSLEQRICAINYLQGRERACAGFVRLPKVEPHADDCAQREVSENSSGWKDTTIKIVDRDGNPKAGERFQVFYVGEMMCDCESDASGSATVTGTIDGNGYKLIVLGERKKDSKTFRVVGGEINIVRI
ncbi:MAG: hypothetical protein KGH57_03195 [Candidatus Micrarchaeota archaeon]|nr:hypothetical protein [Candidatus Micrarchaeota archaeon]